MSAFSDWVLSKSPLNYWRLGEPSGTNADDLGSANNDGTYVNSPTLAVASGTPDSDTAVTFNGTTQRVTTGARIPTNSTRTIMFICRWNGSLPSGFEPVIGHYDDFDIYFGSNITTCTVDLNAIAVTNTISGMSADVWYRCVVKVDQVGDTCQVWINGVDEGSLAMPTNSKGTLDLRLAWDDGGGEFFTGSLDEIAIFSGAWTQTDVNQLEEAYYGDYGYYIKTKTGLINYWRFGEASGTKAIDEKGTNHGTYVGSPAHVAGDLPGSGNVNTAIDLNGSSQYVTTGTNVPANSTRTFVALAKLDNISAYRTLFGDQNDFKVTISNSGNFEVDVGGGNWISTPLAIHGDGEFHRIVVMFNQSANSLKAWCDGTLLDTQSASTNTVATNFRIGNNSSTEYWDGAIDEFAIFSTAWTQTDVDELEDQFTAVPADNTMKPGLPGMFTPQLEPTGWF